MIAAPPLETGAVHTSDTCVLPAVPIIPVGAPAVVRGVTAADWPNAPSPTAFTAATWNTYSVPFVRPVTVALVAVDVPSANRVHVVPPLLEYCTR